MCIMMLKYEMKPWNSYIYIFFYQFKYILKYDLKRLGLSEWLNPKSDSTEIYLIYHPFFSSENVEKCSSDIVGSVFNYS